MNNGKVWDLFWIGIGILAVVLAISLIVRFVFLPTYYPSMGYYGMMGGSFGFGWIGMTVFGISALMLMILLFYLFLRVLVPSTGNDVYRDARKIAVERYSRGEISESELKEIVKEFDRRE